jgi:hypothetical protein
MKSGKVYLVADGVCIYLSLRRWDTGCLRVECLKLVRPTLGVLSGRNYLL